MTNDVVCILQDEGYTYSPYDRI